MTEDIWRKVRISQAPAEKPATAAIRGYTEAELARARKLRGRGKSWKQIARALGRRSGDGIKRRLDEDYRAHRNAYHAAYTHAERLLAKSAEAERHDASPEEIRDALCAIATRGAA